MKLYRFLAITLLTFSFSLTVTAQESRTDSDQDDDILKVETAGQVKSKRMPSRDSSLYVVSAKAGIVNLAEGDVAYKRSDSEWDLLIGGDELRSGDVVKTGVRGRAEILLSPGSFLRISTNSEVSLADASLDALKIQVVKGSAIIEVSMGGGKGEVIATLITPHTKFLVIEGGIYRINVDASRTTAMVRKGKLVIYGDESGQVARHDQVTIYNKGVKSLITGTIVKSKKKIIVEGAEPLVASLNKTDEDNFDEWSKDRAETLVAANRRLSNRALNRTLLGGSNSLWVYNPFLGSYTYLPGWYGFYSPYGWGYSTYCNPYYRRYYPSNGGSGGGWYRGGTGGSGSGGSGSGRGGTGTGSGSGSGQGKGGVIGRPGGGHGGLGNGGSIGRPGTGRAGDGGRGAAPANPRRN